MMPFYNRIAAVNYATTWAYNYNPMWISDSSLSGGGGDCTNFISQALYTGGWKMVTGSRWDGRAWYSGGPLSFNRHNRSHTWAGAEPFSDFLKRSGRAKPCGLNDLIIGDLVQEFMYGQIIHTMIVTKLTRTGGNLTPCLTYHSTNTLDMPFPSVQTRAGSDASFIFWKILDLYREYSITAKGGKMYL
jgi:Putative amidase domain